MSHIKQSVSWWCFVPGKMTPEELARAAAEIGYAGVELVKPEYWQLAKDHGLAIASIDGHRSIMEGLNRRENNDRIEHELGAKL